MDNHIHVYKITRIIYQASHAGCIDAKKISVYLRYVLCSKEVLINDPELCIPIMSCPKQIIVFVISQGHMIKDHTANKQVRLVISSIIFQGAFSKGSMT